MTLFDKGAIPVQRVNTAEYLTRGRPHQLFLEPILSDGQVAETVRRILRLVETAPAEPAFLRQFADRSAGWRSPSRGRRAGSRARSAATAPSIGKSLISIRTASR